MTPRSLAAAPLQSPLDESMSTPLDDVDQQRFAEIVGLPVLPDLTGRQPAPEFLRRFGIAYARRHRLLGCRDVDDGPLMVAVCDRHGWSQLDLVSRVLQQRATPLLTTRSSLIAAINTAYADRSSQAQQVLDSLDERIDLSDLQGISGQEDLLDTDGRRRSSVW